MKTTILVLLATLGVSSSAQAGQNFSASCRKIAQRDATEASSTAKDAQKKDNSTAPAVVR